MSGSSSSTMSNTPPQLGALQVSQSTYGAVVAIVYGKTRIPGNLIWYGDFKATAQQQSSGGKGGGGTVTTGYTYTASVAIALGEGTISSVGTVWSGNAVVTLPSTGLSLFEGAPGQTPWGYLTTNFPGQDLAYQNLAYCAGANIALDGNAALPAFNFEVTGFPAYPYSGIVDCNPKDVMLDFMTNSYYGCGFPAAQIGDLTQYSNYCVASGLFVSPAYTSQDAASTYLQNLMDITNSAIFFSEGLLKIVPYGDQTVTGNGVTYTPNINVIYDLDDDDYIINGKDTPVQCDRQSQDDSYNWVTIEFLNRTNNYNPEPIDAYDTGSISTYGLRQSQSVQYHEICDPDVARTSSQLLLQRSVYIRNRYSFTLGLRYSLLEPMDIVTLTDSFLGLNQAPVRIISVEENEDGLLDIVAEEYPDQVSHAKTYPSQPNSGFAFNYNVSPGICNTPMMFPAPDMLTQGLFEIWIATSGSDPNYGGCEIWISDDGDSYQMYGVTEGPNRMGHITTTLNQVGDPDTTSVLGVDISESNGYLYPGTQQQADDGIATLCFTNGEYFSYRDATLTGTGTYNLGYLRRGLYGSTIQQHPAGKNFVRCDGLYQLNVSPALAGKLIYIKCRPFNLYGQGKPDLSTCVATPYNLGGSTAAVIASVSGLEIAGQGNNTVFTGLDVKFDWLSASAGGTAYDVGSEPSGANSGTVDVSFKCYQIKILSAPVTGQPVVLRTTTTTDTSWTYSYQNNCDDNGGIAQRTFTIQVFVVNTNGQISQFPSSLTVSNPAPPAPINVYATPGPAQVTVGADKPSITDFGGMIVFGSNSSGFTPGTGNIVYQGPNNFYADINLVPLLQRYYVIAFYDQFSSAVSGLNLSSQITATPQAGTIQAVTSLPATGAYNGQTLFLISTQALYTWSSATSSWISYLTPNSSYVLQGTAQLASTGGILAGNVTWNSSGTITGGSGGVVLTAKGITGWNGSSTTFAVDQAGNASFAGTLAANIVTAGNINVINLSAISSNMGTITAGTIQTGTSGNHMVLASATNDFTIYDGSGNTACYINGNPGTAPLANFSLYGIIGTTACFCYNHGSNTGSSALDAVSDNGGIAAQISATSGGGKALVVFGNSTNAAVTINNHGNTAMVIDGAVVMTAAGGAMETTNCFPITDNTYTNGTASFAWSNIYSHAALTVVSDKRSKTAITNSNLGLPFIEMLRSRMYRKKGEQTIHYGFVAQEVQEALEKSGATGIVVHPEGEDGRFMLRYEELIAPMVKAIQQLSAKVTELEKQLKK